MTQEMMQEQQEQSEVTVSILEMLKLSQAQQDALAAKFAKLPKLQKNEVRKIEGFEHEVETYAAYILSKMANDYLFAQMRDIWVSRLELLIPRLLTKDEKLKKATEDAVAVIAAEITDSDERVKILDIVEKNWKTTDRLNKVECIERAIELFNSVHKA